MSFAREIFQQIKNYFRSQRAEKEMDSHYTILGNTLVRVSNHCTYMYVWDNYFEKNPKDRSMNIISLVFEDNANTFNNDCLVLKQNRKRPINVSEYVFPINGNGKFITRQDIKTIIKDLKKLENEGVYNDSTSKSTFFKRTSINPTSQNISQTEDGNLIHTPISG